MRSCVNALCRGAAARRRVRQARCAGRQVIGTPSHAVFVAADTPYPISFPGSIGDRALVLRFGDELAPDHVDRRGDAALASNGLLPAPAMMLRNLLGARIGQGENDSRL